MKQPKTFTSVQLILFFGIIIIILPILITQFSIIDYTKTGTIGDTIGGITAPFINALGAYLVFIAFKQQVRANNLFYETEKAKSIFEQVFDLDDKSQNHQSNIQSINTHTGTFHKSIINDTMISRLDNAKYLLSSLLLTYSQLNQLMQGNQKTFLKNKLDLLYKIKFSRDFDKLLYYTDFQRSEIVNIYLDRIDEIKDLVNQIQKELLNTPPINNLVY